MTSDAPSAAPGDAATPALSVVIPMKDEAGNVDPLLAEIEAALAPRLVFEVICVDDGSGDGTSEELAAAKARRPWLRVLRHKTACGQSTATVSGVLAARADWVVTLDGDGQNPPGEIPKLLDARDAAADPAIHLFAGERIKRQDSAVRRFTSRSANTIRRWMLDDGVRDTGCSLKLFRRDTFLRLPYFDHMHRFIPALVLRTGATLRTVPVDHRPRTRGSTKYGFHNRALAAITDLIGVMWLRHRSRRPVFEPMD